jgi:hypothetical protein
VRIVGQTQLRKLEGEREITFGGHAYDGLAAACGDRGGGESGAAEGVSLRRGLAQRGRKRNALGALETGE